MLHWGSKWNNFDMENIKLGIWQCENWADNFPICDQLIISTKMHWFHFSASMIQQQEWRSASCLLIFKQGREAKKEELRLNQAHWFFQRDAELFMQKTQNLQKMLISFYFHKLSIRKAWTLEISEWKQCSEFPFPQKRNI